jgi:hypothetical protein
MIREPGDLPSSVSTRQTSVGVYRWMARKTPNLHRRQNVLEAFAEIFGCLSVLARAGRKICEDSAVFHYRERAVDDPPGLVALVPEAACAKP